MKKIRHPVLLVVVLIVVVVGTYLLDHSAYRSTMESVTTVMAFIIAGRRIYRNYETGQYRLPGRH